MATATLERTETTQNGAKTTTKSAMPVLDVEINGIASKNGLQPDFVANSISNSGGMVARVGEIFVTTREAWSGFVDGYLNQIREGLLGSGSATTSSPTTTSKPATRKTQARSKSPARKPAKAKTTTTTPQPAKGETLRFRSFKLSNSYNKTLGNFLDAQKWEPARRIEIVEAIANLPATPTDEASTAEQCLKRIINVYPTTKRKGGGARQGVIDAAKSMIGTGTN